jgi:CRISPR-associated exonuclease Cas4
MNAERGESGEEESLLPLSALQHYLYCPRQCALIHLEQVWAENQWTAEGRVMHERAHEGPDERRAAVRVMRGMPVVSRVLGISGQCDVVEFHADGSVLPVEYKRGKPKAHRADEVQLCAQAVALEEMLGKAVGGIGRGCLYYGENRRRHEVVLDGELRSLTAEVARGLHGMMQSGRTPAAEYERAKCEGCSLRELCLPKAAGRRKRAGEWFAGRLAAESQMEDHRPQPEGSGGQMGDHRSQFEGSGGQMGDHNSLAAGGGAQMADNSSQPSVPMTPAALHAPANSGPQSCDL